MYQDIQGLSRILGHLGHKDMSACVIQHIQGLFGVPGLWDIPGIRTSVLVYQDIPETRGHQGHKDLRVLVYQDIQRLSGILGHPGH